MRGTDVTLFLSDGIPTVLDVFDDLNETKATIDHIAERFETNSSYPVLLLLKYCFDFLKGHFDYEVRAKLVHNSRESV
jgi:hypothetical protein